MYRQGVGQAGLFGDVYMMYQLEPPTDLSLGNCATKQKVSRRTERPLQHLQQITADITHISLVSRIKSRLGSLMNNTCHHAATQAEPCWRTLCGNNRNCPHAAHTQCVWPHSLRSPYSPPASPPKTHDASDLCTASKESSCSASVCTKYPYSRTFHQHHLNPYLDRYQCLVQDAFQWDQNLISLLYVGSDGIHANRREMDA